MLVIDAFSSDAPPSHLLTLEAIADADRALAEDGLLGIHVSNRYYDLAPPVAAALRGGGPRPLAATCTSPTPRSEREGGIASVWLWASRDPASSTPSVDGWLERRPRRGAADRRLSDLLRWFGR